MYCRSHDFCMLKIDNQTTTQHILPSTCTFAKYVADIHPYIKMPCDAIVYTNTFEIMKEKENQFNL